MSVATKRLLIWSLSRENTQSCIFRNCGRIMYKSVHTISEAKSFESIPGPTNLPVIGTILPYKLGKNLFIFLLHV